MSSNTRLRAYLYASVAAGAISLPATSAFAVCQGPGAPTNTETKCVTAITIPPATPGTTLQSFDISWVDPARAEYYLADRANKGIDIIDTQSLTFKRRIGGFAGIVFNSTGTKINNNVSGPDGVTTHNRWLYAGDGDSTLKVFDLDSSASQTISTGGTTRLDEMALTTDGTLIIAANNAEDPPFATLFHANGDNPPPSNVTKISKITVDATIIPPNNGLSMEQPAWDPKTARFLVSIPQIANNPTGCTFDGSGGHPFCQGGLAIINPATVTPGTFTLGAFNATTNTGVLPLHDCGPNGATVGPHDNVMLGCTPGNVPTNTTTQVINATTKNFVEVGNITGSDEVWFNKGDHRYYLGASKMNFNFDPTKVSKGSVLGVVNAQTNFLVETIPSSDGSHSVAADSKRNLIFLPEVCTTAPPAPGIAGAPPNVGCDGNKDVVTGNTVGQEVCGGTAGCVAVYQGEKDQENEQAEEHEQSDGHGG